MFDRPVKIVPVLYATLFRWSRETRAAESEHG